MFKEELKLIRETEEKADLIRKEAKRSAKVMLEAADAEANKLVEEAFADEREKCKAILEEGRAIAQQEYDVTIAKAQAECETMEKQAAAKHAAAVSLIAERIVESSVNY